MSVVETPVVTPYKGLAPFEDSDVDALLFFGRERETEVVVANLLASKLTVLYGPSGVGKSSILRAGVARRLREIAPDADVLVLDEWAAEPKLPDATGETFFILDQFEEYFLYHDEGPLHDRLPALLAEPYVHVLIALREDALARLDAFQARVPNVFANRLRLDQLDASAARAAIVGPLDRWNAVVPADERVGIETALVDDVLAQVESSPGRIEAPYLQLVLERVWDEERSSGSSVLREQTLQRLGGAERIVSAHLERALGELPPREAEIATSALKFLVTPSRTKIAHSFGDLVGYTNESPVELQQVLEVLASQRILRAVADGDESSSRYEIFHDVLAEPVLAWRRDFEGRAALERAARRHRRLGFVAGGAVLLAVAMIALTVYAFAQRGEASKQRRVAVQQADLALGQKAIAQRARRAAERQKHSALVAKENAIAQKQRADRAKQDAIAAAAQAKRDSDRANASEARAKSSEASANASARQALVSEQAAERSKKLAVKEQHRAQGQARLAKKRALVARVGQYVANAEAKLDVDPVQSVRSALAAAALERSSRVEDALRDSLVAIKVRAILHGGGGPVNSAVFSPDGSLAATGAAGGDVRLFRVGSATPLVTVKAGGPVFEVAFSPDGKLLAIAAGRHALVYDVAARRVLQTLPHKGAVLDLAWADGGRYLVTGSADLTTRIWDPQSGSLLQAITGSGSQSVVAVSPDGTRIAVVSKGVPTAQIYSVPSGAPVSSVTQPGDVTDLAWSPNGAYLVTTGTRNAFVWDTNTWELRHTLTGHSASITDVAFSPDGSVVTSSIDSSGRVWDPATGQSLFTLGNAHQQKILAVAVSPDGQQIATASADETTRLWDAPLGTIPRILGGHTDAVVGVTYSPDGSLLLTASADGTARIWQTEVQSLHDVGTQGGAVSTVAYSPDGRLVLSAGADGTAKVWRGTQLVQTLPQGGKVTAASFTADGRSVLTAGDDGSAKLWRVADGKLLATFAHGAAIRAAAVGSSTVVTGGDDGIVREWSLTGTPLATFTHGSRVTALALAANGTVASGGTDGSIRLWPSGRVLRGHTDDITSLAFNGAGTMLVSGSADKTARTWNARTGAPLKVLAGHTLGITSVTFNPSGKLIATASQDGDAWLWYAASGRIAHKLKFHVSTVTRAAFSPDGRWVVTAGPTAAAIWQVRSGKLLYFMHGAHGNLTWAAWAPDSLRIVTGDKGGGVETFTCSVCAGTASLVAQAKARLAELR